MSRFTCLLLCLLATLVAVWLWPKRSSPAPSNFAEFMEQEHLSGMILAVHANGRLLSSQVLEPAKPADTRTLSLQTRFPIASLSKPLTAATARALVHEHKLRLEDRLVDLLPALPYANDDGYRRITVKNLLQHTGGFDRIRSGDPIFNSRGEIVDCEDAINDAVRRPLDAPPGTRMIYSNIGYCLLGKIIEKAAHQPYEQAVLTRFPRLKNGATLGPPPAAPDTNSRSRFGDFRAAGSAGGWYSTAPALAEQLANDARDPLIEVPITVTHGDYYYGLGWRIWPHCEDHLLTHYGSLRNVFSVAVASRDGRAAVALFLGRPSDDEAAFRRVLPLMKAALSSPPHEHTAP